MNMTAFEHIRFGIEKTLANPALIFLGLLSTTLTVFPEVFLEDHGFLGWGILLILSPILTAGMLYLVHRVHEGDALSFTPFLHGIRRFTFRILAIAFLLGVGGIFLLLGILFLNVLLQPFLVNLSAVLLPALIFPLIVLWDVIIVVEDWPLNEALASAVDAGKARYKTLLALILLSALLSPFSILSTLGDIFAGSPLFAALLHPGALVVYLIFGSFFTIVFLFAYMSLYREILRPELP